MAKKKILGATPRRSQDAGSIDTPERQAHTPGPWAVQHGEFIVTPQGNTLAHVWDDDLDHDIDPEAERDANAQLIAAAPAMKQALEYVLKHCGDPVMENVARAAIEIAEGR